MRGLRVVYETEKRMSNSAASRRASVVLPAPEGDEITRSRPRETSLDIAGTIRRFYSIFCACSRSFSSSALPSMTKAAMAASWILPPRVLSSRPIS